MAEKECFVIMPISEQTGYESDHFDLIYNDIIKVACEKAGYKAVRSDDVKQTNLIHKDILQRILDAPMAICDLSSNNPNVLFELGIRQAFDKPTVLIKDKITKSIFDLSPLRYTEYNSTHKYRDVLKSQEIVKEAIISTEKASKENNNINSLISLLSLPNAASLKTDNKTTDASVNYLILQQISDMQQELKTISYRTENFSYSEPNDKDSILSLINQLKKLISDGYPKSVIQNNYYDITNKINDMSDFLSKVEKDNINKELLDISAYLKE